MFRLADLDSKATELSTEREDLEVILKSSVPGLVSDFRKQDGSSPTDNSTLQDGSATGHKLLIDSTVFNMGVMLPPSLTFLDRLKEIVPPNANIVMSTLTSFLDDFLVNVFQPQLDETLMDLCAQIFVELDAFQIDTQWETYAQKPVFKGTVRFCNLVSAVCTMLSSLPHDQAFSQLIITQMSTYFEKCRGWFKALVSRPQSRSAGGRSLKAAAFLAESGDLSDIISTLCSNTTLDIPTFQQLLEKEVEQLVQSTRERPIEDADLVSDRKNIAALCLLHTSMKWLAASAKSLRYISDRAIDSSHDASRAGPKRRWTALGSSQRTTNSEFDDTSAYLPLNLETAKLFDGVVNNYHWLADLVLRTLHLEIRIHILHHPPHLPDPTHPTLHPPQPRRRPRRRHPQPQRRPQRLRRRTRHLPPRARPPLHHHGTRLPHRRPAPAARAPHRHPQRPRLRPLPARRPRAAAESQERRARGVAAAERRVSGAVEPGAGCGGGAGERGKGTRGGGGGGGVFV